MTNYISNIALGNNTYPIGGDIIDGQWITINAKYPPFGRQYLFSTDGTVGSYSENALKTNSAFPLPTLSDGTYLFAFFMYGSTVNSSSGGTCRAYLGTVEKPYDNRTSCIRGHIYVSKADTQCTNYVLLPLTVTNMVATVYLQVQNHNFNSLYIYTVGCRKIGTNT